MQKSTRRDTRAALIRAAERLFAERGLGGVSVRDITRAAGARNESALHYHFGGMEPLMREVFASRYREIEQARRTEIARLDAAGRGDEIEALLAAAIGPLFEACEDEEGRLYVRFCVQLASDPRFDLAELVEEIGMESAIDLGRRLRTMLDGLPVTVLSARLRRLLPISIQLAADHVRQVEAGTALPFAAARAEAAVSLAGFLKAQPALPR